MFFRIIVSVGLLALGYYVGHEIGRAEPIRKDLKDLRDNEDEKITASKVRVSRTPPEDPNS
jgi:hypothetical protein